MEFTRDDRAVSEVIGAILVFGLLIALLSVMQTYAVPLANEEVEFNHNQDVQSDLANFLEASSRTASHGTQESTRLRMGTTYPTRLLFFNPPQPGGEIRTVGDQEASIDNIESPDENVDQAIGDDNQIDGLEAKRLEYEPNYNEWSESPTVVMEYGAIYNDFGDRHTLANEPHVLNGNTIDLTFFAGELAHTSAGPRSLTARPTSAPARTVSIQNQTNDPITVTIPSRMNASTWEEMLDDEPKFSHATEPSDGAVTLHLEPGQYSLRMAQIGVGNAVETPEAHYTTRASSRVQTLDVDGGASQLPIEVRDEYNNPVSDEDVYVQVSSGDLNGDGQTTTATTNDQGQPMLVYTPQETGRITVQASYENEPWDESSGFDPDQNREDLEFDIAVNEWVDENQPEVVDFEIMESDCDQLGLLGITLEDNECAISVNYTVTDQDENLDTVEVRMIRSDDRSVADSVVYDIDTNSTGGQDSREGVVVIDDEDPPQDQEYDVRVIATDTGGLQGAETIQNHNPEQD